MAVEGPPQRLVCIPTCLRQDLFMFTTEYSRLAGPKASRESLLSTSHPATGAVEIQTHTRAWEDSNSGPCVASALPTEHLLFPFFNFPMIFYVENTTYSFHADHTLPPTNIILVQSALLRTAVLLPKASFLTRLVHKWKPEPFMLSPLREEGCVPAATGFS